MGGMKDSDLKKSENCSIILATYAMAAEALDIKTLTTLVLATPRTDVTQAVGRILRVKHERPLIIDIIDSHSVFKRQWQKRYSYYVKNKYKVVRTNNYLYNQEDNDEKWELLFEKSMKRAVPLSGQRANKKDYNKAPESDKLGSQGICLINI